MTDHNDLRQRILPLDDLEAAPPQPGAHSPQSEPAGPAAPPFRARRRQTRACELHTWRMVEFLPGRYKLRCLSCRTRGPSLRSAT